MAIEEKKCPFCDHPILVVDDRADGLFGHIITNCPHIRNEVEVNGRYELLSPKAAGAYFMLRMQYPDERALALAKERFPEK